ncbi:MAG: hypothetical protein JSW27_17350 [Phycisphaerales bacterium]|nr:MAG: hypothetical protein JSW27_17350 [Phycisphaerales bacterium]
MTNTTDSRRTVAAIALSCLLLALAASGSFEATGRKAATETTEEQVNSEAPKTDDYYDRPVETFVANPFCKACHLDFDEDELALNHEIAGIGCERCHGESLKHRSDEANITPPQLMYPKERINPSCMMCHPRHEIRHVEDHQTILEAGLSVFETEEASCDDKDAKKYCIDCHGPHHRMKVRTIRWNKATGEVLK